MSPPPGRRSAATFTEGSIQKHVMHLSLVMILGFLAMTIGQLIEVFYIGMVGKLELAAIAFTFPITMSMNALTRGIGIGGSTIIAQSMGAGDRVRTAITMTHCYLLVILFTVVVALLGQVYAVSLFSLIGASDEVLDLAESYAHIWLIGFPLMGIAMVSNGLIRSFGNANFPGFIMTVAPVVQVLTGPFFIFGLAGFPAMGLDGAAWAFVAGTCAQMVLVGHWYLVREKLFNASMADFVESSKQILHVGIPAAASNLIQPLSIGVVTWLLAGFGTSVVAGFGVASRIESVVAMVVIGISTSVVPLVGQNWGAGKYDRVYAALKTCYLACLAWGVLAAAIMWLGAGYFVNAINEDPSLVETAVAYLHIVPFSIGFLGLITVATHALNALRRPIPALVISVARLLVVYLPLAYAFSQYFGYEGIFIALVVANVLVGIVAVAWNHRTMQNQQAAMQANDIAYGRA